VVLCERFRRRTGLVNLPKPVQCLVFIKSFTGVRSDCTRFTETGKSKNAEKGNATTRVCAVLMSKK
jgi:hypothetical protein